MHVSMVTFNRRHTVTVWDMFVIGSTCHNHIPKLFFACDSLELDLSYKQHDRFHTWIKTSYSQFLKRVSVAFAIMSSITVSFVEFVLFCGVRTLFQLSAKFLVGSLSLHFQVIILSVSHIHLWFLSPSLISFN